jgi:hypothetical protein
MNRILIFFYLLFVISVLVLPEYSFSQPENYGSMGIGITTPTLAKLQVNGVSGNGNTSAIFGGESTGISFQRNWPTIGFNQYRDNTAGNGKYIGNGYAAIQYLDPNTGYMYFDMFPNGTANTLTTGGTRALTISNVGNIGIRTGATNASFYATKSGNFDGAAVFGGTYYNSYFCYGTQENTYIRGGFSNSKVFINDNNSGNIILGAGDTYVGINTYAPIATLDIHQVSGKGYVIVDPDQGFNNWDLRAGYYFNPPESDLKLYYDGILVGYFSIYGFYSYTTSDRRMKTNIKPLPSVLNKLTLLQPKEYEMKDHNQSHEKTFGFIAQDVNKVYPEFVRVNHLKIDSANRIPDLYSLNYNGFDAITIKALQEQYEQIKTLEKENDELLRILVELEKKLF